jgi:hypothetical protein
VIRENKGKVHHHFALQISLMIFGTKALRNRQANITG